MARLGDRGHLTHSERAEVGRGPFGSAGGLRADVGALRLMFGLLFNVFMLLGVYFIIYLEWSYVSSWINDKEYISPISTFL